MGSFLFKWEHPAEEVYVTGTFDNWTKSEKLVKEGNVFQKTVDLRDASSKIYYKFVVDGTWVTNESAPKELDHEGNVNNFLLPENITKHSHSHSHDPAPALLNTITPSSTTATMAGQQPIESTRAVEAPLSDKPTEINLLNTVTPTSTTAALAGEQPIEHKPTEERFDEAPHDEPRATPSASDIPGGFPITPANELGKFFGVDPLPAADRGVNPITLAPGEKIPETIAAQNTHSHVKLDKESYEKSDALPGLETELPPVSKNMIPESSLPMTSFQDSFQDTALSQDTSRSTPNTSFQQSFQDTTLSNVTPTATTAGLAGKVPLEHESKVPAIVKESQEKARFSPEASGIPAEVNEKAKLEEELLERVPEVPATSEGISGVGPETPGIDVGNLAALAATAGGAVIAAGIALKDTVQEQAIPAISSAAGTVQEQTAPYISSAAETVQNQAAPYITSAAETAHHNLPDSVKEQLPVSAQNAIADRADQAREERIEEIAPAVPAEVNASIVESRTSPEAAANTQAVEEKKLVERELLSEIKRVPAEDETKHLDVAADVPAEVRDSITKSGKSPEAAANTEAVEDKRLVEAELLQELKPTPAHLESKDESIAPRVPAQVQDSIIESGKGPEAAGNTEAVQEKSLVEAELLREVKPTPAVGETTTEGSKFEERRSEVSPESSHHAPEHVAPVVDLNEAPQTHQTHESQPQVHSEVNHESVPTESAPIRSAYESVTDEHTQPEVSRTHETPVHSEEPAVVIPKTEELRAKEPQTAVPQTEELTTKEPLIEAPKTEPKIEPKSELKSETQTDTPVVKPEVGSSTIHTKPENVSSGVETKPETKAPENRSSTTDKKAADTASNGSSRAAEQQRKKHNRLSSIFTKIKHKFSDK